MSYVAKFTGAFLLFVISLVRLVHGIKYANCECGLGNSVQNRIVGGWDASPHEFPWLVAVNRRGNLYCGGAIINNLYIVTAGHCVRWEKRSELSIVVGQHNRRIQDGVPLVIEKMILHRNFYSHRLYDEFDIALIKLVEPLQFSHDVSPVCLPKTYSTYFNNIGTVAGWGKVGGNRRSGGILQQTLVRVLSNLDCRKTRMKSYLNSHILCAYTDNRDACQGDSGGPLTFERDSGKTEIIGIVSWGMGCATRNVPGIYTKITYFLGWIYKNTQDATYCRDNYTEYSPIQPMIRAQISPMTFQENEN